MWQLGLGVAAEYVLKIGIEAIWERIQHIAGILRQQLHGLKGATVQDRGRLLCGIVSFTMVRLRSKALSCQQTTVRYLSLARVLFVHHTSICTYCTDLSAALW